MTRTDIVKDFLKKNCVDSISCVVSLFHVQAGVYKRRRNRLFQGMDCLWRSVRDMAAARVANPSRV